MDGLIALMITVTIIVLIHLVVSMILIDITTVTNIGSKMTIL